MNSTKFFDAAGICKKPIVAFVKPDGKIEVDDSHAPVNRETFENLYHRYAGQDYTDESGDIVAVHEIHSRASKFNKAVDAANGLTGESAGFGSSV